MGAPSFLSFPQRLGIPASQWRELKWQLLCELRVAAPGIIQSFDAAKQTVSVQLTVLENINNAQTLVPTSVQIPILSDVPLVLPRAGGFVVTLPVKVGDECLVIFGDNDYGAWWFSGGSQAQVTRRRHDLSDGFAILAPWSQPRVIADYSTDSLEIRSDDGTQAIEVRTDAINITVGSGDVTVNSQNGNVNVTGQKVVVTGSAEVDISGSGVTKIEGRNFLLHEHTGVQPGGGTSGPVV